MKWNRERSQLFIACTSMTATFTILKLFGFANWSWVWIFSPLWLSGLGIGAAFLAYKIMMI